MLLMKEFSTELQRKLSKKKATEGEPLRVLKLMRMQRKLSKKKATEEEPLRVLFAMYKL